MVKFAGPAVVSSGEQPSITRSAGASPASAAALDFTAKTGVPLKDGSTVIVHPKADGYTDTRFADDLSFTKTTLLRLVPTDANRKKLALILQKLAKLLGIAGNYSVETLLAYLKKEGIDINKLLTLDPASLDFTNGDVQSISVALKAVARVLGLNEEQFTPAVASALKEWSPGSNTKAQIIDNPAWALKDVPEDQLLPPFIEKLKAAKGVIKAEGAVAERERVAIEATRAAISAATASGTPLEKLNALITLYANAAHKTIIDSVLSVRFAEQIMIQLRAAPIAIGKVDLTSINAFIVSKLNPGEKFISFTLNGTSYVAILSQTVKDYIIVSSTPRDEWRHYSVSKGDEGWVIIDDRKTGIFSSGEVEGTNVIIMAEIAETAPVVSPIPDSPLDPIFTMLLASGAIKTKDDNSDLADGQLTTEEARARGFSDAAIRFWSDGDGVISAEDAGQVFNQHINIATQGLDESSRKAAIAAYVTTKAGFVYVPAGRIARTIMGGNRSSISANELLAKFVSVDSSATAERVIRNLSNSGSEASIDSIPLSRDQITAFVVTMGFLAQVEVKDYTVDTAGLENKELLGREAAFLEWLKTGKATGEEEDTGSVGRVGGGANRGLKRSLRELDRSDTKRQTGQRRQTAIGIMQSLISDPTGLMEFWKVRTNVGSGSKFVEQLAEDANAHSIIINTLIAHGKYQEALEFLQALPEALRKTPETSNLYQRLASTCFNIKDRVARLFARDVLKALLVANEAATISQEADGSFRRSGLNIKGAESVVDLIRLVETALQIPDSIFFDEYALFEDNQINEVEEEASKPCIGMSLRARLEISDAELRKKAEAIDIEALQRTPTPNVNVAYAVVLKARYYQALARRTVSPNDMEMAMKYYRMAWDYYEKSAPEQVDKVAHLRKVFIEMVRIILWVKNDKALAGNLKKLAVYIPAYNKGNVSFLIQELISQNQYDQRTGSKKRYAPLGFRDLYVRGKPHPQIPVLNFQIVERETEPEVLPTGDTTAPASRRQEVTASEPAAPQVAQEAPRRDPSALRPGAPEAPARRQAAPPAPPAALPQGAIKKTIEAKTLRGLADRCISPDLAVCGTLRSYDPAFIYATRSSYNPTYDMEVVMQNGIVVGRPKKKA